MSTERNRRSERARALPQKRNTWRIPHWGLAILGVVVLIGGAFGLLFTPLFDIDSVETQPGTHVGREEIISAAEVELGTPLAFAPTGEIARRVKSIPWVASARVERGYPGTIKIWITERVPVASIERDPGVFALLDDTGRVLTDQTTPSGVMLGGVRDVPVAGARLEHPELASVAGNVDGENWPGAVLSMEFDTRGIASYFLRTSDDLEIRLGDDTAIAQKLGIAKNITAAMPAGTVYIDVATPNRPVSGGASSSSSVPIDVENR